MSSESESPSRTHAARRRYQSPAVEDTEDQDEGMKPNNIPHPEQTEPPAPPVFPPDLPRAPPLSPQDRQSATAAASGAFRPDDTPEGHQAAMKWRDSLRERAEIGGRGDVEVTHQILNRAVINNAPPRAGTDARIRSAGHVVKKEARRPKAKKHTNGVEKMKEHLQVARWKSVLKKSDTLSRSHTWKVRKPKGMPNLNQVRIPEDEWNLDQSGRSRDEFLEQEYDGYDVFTPTGLLRWLRHTLEEYAAGNLEVPLWKTKDMSMKECKRFSDVKETTDKVEMHKDPEMGDVAEGAEGQVC